MGSLDRGTTFSRILVLTVLVHLETVIAHLESILVHLEIVPVHLEIVFARLEVVLVRLKSPHVEREKKSIGIVSLLCECSVLAERSMGQVARVAGMWLALSLFLCLANGLAAQGYNFCRTASSRSISFGVGGCEVDEHPSQDALGFAMKLINENLLQEGKIEADVTLTNVVKAFQQINSSVRLSVRCILLCHSCLVISTSSPCVQSIAQ